MARDAEETRFQLQKDRMLRAAAQCFNEKGYSGSSLKDVANLLGLTDAALYYYVQQGRTGLPLLRARRGCRSRSNESRQK
ncbi:MAG: TetR/AcrR family transcriptional regulator [Gammaproteobacteria bacterium]|nr:TetR/AcrR family transcriptional regulator [Gammaproteobacteria bacterium]NNL49626.1 helix-turn-helix transcriptional regulator [Woeseiaceae bacterium]